MSNSQEDCNNLIDELLNNEIIRDLSLEEIKQCDLLSISKVKIQTISNQLTELLIDYQLEQSIKVNLNLATLTRNVNHMLNVINKLLTAIFEEEF